MAISMRNAVALAGNAIRHADLLLRQRSIRGAGPEIPYKPTPAPGESGGLPEIPSGRTLMVIGQATEPNVTRSMSDYSAAMGHPGGYSFYLILSGDEARTKRELATMGAFLDRYPGTALLLAIGYGASLTGNIRESQLLLRGRFDPELDALAAWLKSLDRAAFVRPLYEFDRMGMTYGGPELFKSAYRYFVDRVRGHGVDNTAWIWHSAGPVWRLVDSAARYAIASAVVRNPVLADWYVKRYFKRPVRDRAPICRFYPGEGYVDYFAISYWDGSPGLGAFTPAGHDVYMAETRRLFNEARDLGLPLAIAESNPAYIGTNSGQKSERWLEAYFDLIEEFDIRLVSYIAAEFFEEGGVWGSPIFNGFWPRDCRLHAYPDIRRLFESRVAAPRYILQDRESVNEALGWTPSPVPWKEDVPPMPERPRLRWPHCSLPEYPGMGGWCLPRL